MAKWREEREERKEEILEKIEEGEKTPLIDNDSSMETVEKEEIIEEKEKRKIITLDTTEEEVLSYNKEGDIFFLPDEGVFSQLPDNIVKTLSKENRERYLSSYGTWRFNSEAKARELPSDISVDPRMAMASSRLEVSGKDPNKEYYWRRTDEQSQWARDGYVATVDPNVNSFHRGTGNTHRVSYQGIDELILTEIPKELYEERQRVIREKSRKLAVGVESSAADEMRRAGGIPLTQEQLNRENFSSTD